MEHLSIIVATSGRPTLKRTIDSIVPQLSPGDELLVDYNDDAPWGHVARNRKIHQARRNWLMFMDDDDVYLAGALAKVRATLAVQREQVPHIFRMRYSDGRELWQQPHVIVGQVSTQMVCVPRRSELEVNVQFGDRYEGDFDFISEAVRRMGGVRFHEDVIALVRPGADPPDTNAWRGSRPRWAGL